MSAEPPLCLLHLCVEELWSPDIPTCPGLLGDGSVGQPLRSDVSRGGSALRDDKMTAFAKNSCVELLCFLKEFRHLNKRWARSVELGQWIRF